MGDPPLTPPRVSVVVPVRNRRDLLRALLDALAAQTFADHEVVVVDDGSTDGAPDEARADASAGRPIKLVSAGGAGAVAARRLGVSVARGEILAFTDSDCRPEPEWLATGVAAIDAGADAVQGRTVPERNHFVLERTVSLPREDGIYPTCNMFYRREAYDAAGGFDPAAADRLGFRQGSSLRGLGFGEDTLLGWRVRRNGRMVFVSDAVVRHAVFRPDVRDAVRRAWATGGFPALVREVPELRDILLTDRVWLGSRRRAPLYAGAVAAVAGRRRVAAVGLAAWAAAGTVGLVRQERSRRRFVKVLPVQLALDAITAGALVAGSIRARSPVL